MSTSITPFSKPLSYYESLITSEYQGSAKMLAWLAANLKLYQDAAACAKAMLSAFDLNTAIGSQLDILGSIIGVPRLLPFQVNYYVGAEAGPSSGGSGYSVGDYVLIDQYQPLGGWTGMIGQVTSVSGGSVNAPLSFVTPPSTAGFGWYPQLNVNTTARFPATGTGLLVNVQSVFTAAESSWLADNDYRTLLQCNVFRNHWNGQIDSITPYSTGTPPNSGGLSQILGGNVLIVDNGVDNHSAVMTATVEIYASLSPAIQWALLNDMIVPRPQGVQYTFQLA